MLTTVRHTMFNSRAVNEAARLANPRNIARFCGPRVFRDAVEVYWFLHRKDSVSAAVDRAVGVGDAVVDVGASWGLFTAHLARKVGPTGLVDAFEPNPINARALKAAGAGIGNVRVHHVAVSDKAGHAELHVPRVHRRSVTAQGSLQSHSWGPSAQKISVPLVSLDEALPAGREPTFVKIDVEGHELEVLRGAERTLAGLPTVMIEVEQRHLDFDMTKVLDHLAEFGFDMHAIGKHGLFPLEGFDVKRHQLDVLGDGFEAFSVGADYVNNFLATKPAT